MATPRSCPRVFRIQVALPGVSSVARRHLADSTLTLLEGDKRHKPEKWPEGLPFEEQARRSATWELGFLSQYFYSGSCTCKWQERRGSRPPEYTVGGDTTHGSLSSVADRVPGCATGRMSRCFRPRRVLGTRSSGAHTGVTNRHTARTRSDL
ncbi:hypothetical protein F5144DRAFT_166365 [Chaetomium tenue]|uniref:Uncharacterized protein n=1 Tax=Chaetomium tenue TaxID=1854479 RepID=A0ACB7PCT0_9PEZI|nr:hypothetical protein F5144DRAFT_166365 [Chaetomium globosum]